MLIKVVVAAFVFALGSVSTALSAQIGVVTPDIIHLEERAGCSLTLQGEIVAGDLERIRSAIHRLDALVGKKNYEPFDKWHPVLCLNSKGGSYIEGVKIAKFVLNRDDDGFTTYVPDGASCYSACAIIFLAGKDIDRGGEHFPSRFIDVGAHLGFHAQYMNAQKLPNRTYTRQDLSKMYSQGVAETREFVRLFEYRSEGGSRNRG